MDLCSLLLMNMCSPDWNTVRSEKTNRNVGVKLSVFCVITKFQSNYYSFTSSDQSEYVLGQSPYCVGLKSLQPQCFQHCIGKQSSFQKVLH